MGSNTSCVILPYFFDMKYPKMSNIIWFSAQEEFQGEAETLTGDPSKSWLLNNWEGTDHPSACLGMAAAALGEIVFTAVESKAAQTWNLTQLTFFLLHHLQSSEGKHNIFNTTH